MLNVYVVHVFDRDDGMYVFGDEADARRFQTAVRDEGGDASLTREPVCSQNITDQLIDAERDPVDALGID